MVVLPSAQVPNPDISITTAADQDVFPRDHSPYAHDMALKHSQRIALGVEDVDLSIIQSHDDVSRRQVQAGHDTTVLGDSSCGSLATSPPCRIHQVPLLEVRLVCPQLGSGARIRAVKAPGSRHAGRSWQGSRETVHVTREGRVQRDKRLCSRSRCVEGYCSANL